MSKNKKTSVEPPATRLSEEDRMRLTFNAERNRRIQAEMTSAQLGFQRLREELQRAQAESEGLGKTLTEKYKLLPNDQISEDGTIVRAPRQ